MATPRVPDYRGACVTGVVPALLGPGGTRDLPDWFPSSLRGAERVAVLVLDGLGWHQWRARLGLCPVLASMDATRIDTVAPTTTVAALTSITTGLAPAEHGMVGYRMQLGGRIAQMLRWGAEGVDLRAAQPPERVQPCPPFMGAAVPVVSRAEFEDTAFTHAHLRGARHHGWRVASSLPVTVGSLLRGGERFVYAYYDGVDKVAHERGFGPHYDAELAAADALVGAVRDALPRGADLVTLVRVLHDHDDPLVETVLRSAFQALEPGGRLLVAEPLAGTTGAERMGDAYFGIYLWAMGSGRPRSAKELTGMLEKAGFSRIRRLPTRIPLQTSVLVADRA